MNDEQRELLKEILQHEGWNALMLAVDQLTQNQARLVLTAVDEKSTLDEKKRLEGAQRLQRAISKLKKAK